MLRWYPSVLLRVVLELTFVPVAFFSIFVVLVLVRADTPWSLGSWSGTGASAGFWPIPLVVAIGWTLLTLGWRGAKAAFKVGIVVWHLGLTAATIAFVVAAGGFVLEGDAIGLRLSLGVLGPALSLSTLVCAIVWVARDVRRGAKGRSVSPLQRRNKLAAGIAVVLLAVTALAFAFDLDELGVVTGFAATIACHEVIRPLNPSAELHRALVVEGSASE